MKSRLDGIANWEELAQACNYNVNALAKACGVSVRQLRRFFLERTGRTPHQWLSELRHFQALALLTGPELVKEVAYRLGFRQPSHFSRDFKLHCGMPPRDARSAPPLMSDLGNKSPI